MGTAYVYFIQAGEDPALKIGSTVNTLHSRLMSLQTSTHQELRLLGAIDVHEGFGEDQPNRIELARVAMRLERMIQRQFAADRIHGQWFNLTEELREFIQTKSNVA